MSSYQREFPLMKKSPVGKPAENDIDDSMNDFVGPGRKLEPNMKIRLRGEEVNQDSPQKRRELVFNKILQTPSTLLMAAGS